MFPSEQPPRALEGFEVLERIGAGGVGEVFLARSRGGKLVAIKTFVDARRDADEASGAAFVREASVCARLRHPCIVQVRAFLDEPGFSALVFEYVPGVALARVLRLCAARGVRLPDRPAWHVVERVLAALAYAHAFRDERGQPTPIVHRDVSPSNVLLDWTGGVKIADFGIAKVLGVSPSTRVGLVKGTLGCMAPEQARGDAVDERADVYAAGLLAWRLVTGRVPFAKHGKDEIELLRAMRNPRIKPLGSIRPDLPEPLVDAVSRALEPEPERRGITAAEFADAVRSHVDVGGGWLELASLLEKWQGALQRTVKRSPGRDTTESSGRAAHTMRYEEAALLFDDDASPDEPTFEAHALPSDGAEVAPDAIADPGAPASTLALPPAPVAESSPAPPIREPLAPQAHGAGQWGPAVAILIVLGTTALLAALLATYAR